VNCHSAQDQGGRVKGGPAGEQAAARAAAGGAPVPGKPVPARGEDTPRSGWCSWFSRGTEAAASAPAHGHSRPAASR